MGDVVEPVVAPAESATKASNRRLASNSFAMALANIGGRGLGYGYIILMARRLDPRYLGAYAILVTTSMLVELVANLGLDRILVREIAGGSEEAGHGYFLLSLPFRVGMGIVTAGAALLILLLLFHGRLLVPSLSVAIFLSAILPVAAARNCESFLIAHERLRAIAVSQFTERAVTFCAVVALVFHHLSFAGLICVAPLASFCRLLVVAVPTASLWGKRVTPFYPRPGLLFRQSAELLSVEILALVYFRSDMFFVAKFDGLHNAGVYQISYKIFDLCISLFSGFVQAVFPQMVRDNSRSRLLTLVLGGGLVLLVPAGLIICLRNLILGALRPEYLAGAESLIWLMLTVPLVYVTTTFANAAIAAGRVRILIGCAVFLLISNLSLNWFLIPRYSINGAAFTTFACELMSVLILGPVVIRHLSAREVEA